MSRFDDYIADQVKAVLEKPGDYNADVDKGALAAIIPAAAAAAAAAFGGGGALNASDTLLNHDNMMKEMADRAAQRAQRVDYHDLDPSAFRKVTSAEAFAKDGIPRATEAAKYWQSASPSDYIDPSALRKAAAEEAFARNAAQQGLKFTDKIRLYKDMVAEDVLNKAMSQPQYRELAQQEVKSPYRLDLTPDDFAKTNRNGGGGGANGVLAAWALREFIDAAAHNQYDFANNELRNPYAAEDAQGEPIEQWADLPNVVPEYEKVTMWAEPAREERAVLRGAPLREAGSALMDAIKHGFAGQMSPRYRNAIDDYEAGLFTPNPDRDRQGLSQKAIDILRGVLPNVRAGDGFGENAAEHMRQRGF